MPPSILWSITCDYYYLALYYIQKFWAQRKLGRFQNHSITLVEQEEIFNSNLFSELGIPFLLMTIFDGNVFIARISKIDLFF